MRNHARDSISLASLPMVSIAMWGVSPIGWTNTPDITLIDEALSDYEIITATSATPMKVAYE